MTNTTCSRMCLRRRRSKLYGSRRVRGACVVFRRCGAAPDVVQRHGIAPCVIRATLRADRWPWFLRARTPQAVFIPMDALMAYKSEDSIVGLRRCASNSSERKTRIEPLRFVPNGNLFTHRLPSTVLSVLLCTFALPIISLTFPPARTFFHRLRAAQSTLGIFRACAKPLPRRIAARPCRHEHSERRMSKVFHFAAKDDAAT